MTQSPEGKSNSVLGAEPKRGKGPNGFLGALVSELAHDLQPKRLLASLLVGMICGFIAIIYAISAAAFIFAGPLEAHMVVGIGLVLLGIVVLAFLIGMASSLPGMVGFTQEIVLVSLAVMVASISSSLTEVGEGHRVLATVVVVIGLATTLSGFAFVMLGHFRLSRFIRFVPYPVIAGFLAGTGWLIVQGSFGVITGEALSFANLPAFFELSALSKSVPAIAFAALLWAIGRYSKNALALPLAMIAAVVLFHITTALLQISHETLILHGWLVGIELPDQLWPPLSWGDFEQVAWQAVVAEAPEITSLIILAPLALLMNTSGIELSLGRDMDLDRELTASGAANICAGLGGGVGGFHSMSLSVLPHRMGASSRLVGVVVSLVCLAALLFGGPILLLLPKPVLGALLLWIGISLLYEWLFETYAKLDRSDHLVVVLIVFVIAYFGFLEGVVVGLAAGITLFAIDCSRIDIVRNALSGKTYRSSVSRSEALSALLDEHGDNIALFRLQGFMFFGTAHRLLRLVRDRILNADKPPVRYLLLDFRRVSGIDSSAILSFIRVNQLAAAMDLKIVFTDAGGKIRKALERGGLDGTSESTIHYFDDLDHGVEWCEDELLAELAPDSRATARVDIHEQLVRLMRDETAVTALIAILQRVELKTGEYLTRQGEPSQDLFFIEEGQVSIEIDTVGHGMMRLSTMSAGTLVGELAFYLGHRRSTSIRADRDSLAWRLSHEALEGLRGRHPRIASLFHERIVVLLAQRLIRTNALLQTLAD